MNRLLVILISSSFVIPLHLFGYANDGDNGGPHRKINELALKAFIEKAAKDPILSKYDFAPSYKKYPFIGKTDQSGEPFMVESITVLKKGDWAEEDRLQNLAGYSYVTTKFKEGKAKGSFSWWLIEGGMTADEPESFMALRHFYDPKNQMSPGLTDLSDGWIEQTVLLMGENPKMNAMDWGLYASRYSLRDGAKFFKESETALLTVDKQKYLGMSWRCFGEAMHLFADMTVPAHVRNDGHPGIYGEKLSNWAGYFIKTLNVKSDPYEDYVTSSVVDWFAQSPAEEKIIKEIAAAKNPKALFEMTALYTNEKFFSQDTISGQDQLTNVNFNNFNGRANYNLPDLGKAKFGKRDDTAVMYYTVNDSVGELFVCKRRNPNELNSPGEISAALSDPATIAKMHVIDKLVSQSQASRLIPVAVAANERLLELTFPRIGVIIDGINRKNKSLEAHVVTYQQNKDGSFDINSPKDLAGLPTSMPNTIIAMTIGKDTDYYWLPVSSVKGNKFQVSLEEIPGKRLAAYFESDPNNPPETEIKFVAGLEMGGILVKSDEYSPLGISIEPETAMVNTNNSRLFKAKIVGGKNQEIDWSIQEKDGGTVSSSGTYAAPGKAGTYHLTASSRLEPSKRATATIYVSKSDDQPIQKDSQPTLDRMNMSWEALFKSQRIPDYLKFRSSGSRSSPEPKDGTAKYGFVFGMFDEGTGYGWYRILEKGLIKVIKDYNSNGKLDPGDVIQEKPYVVYYELNKDELNINVNRRPEYYGTDYFFLGPFMDEAKTREDYKKEEASLIKPRPAGVGEISVMGLKDINSQCQKGVCWAAIGPFETKVQVEPMIQIKDYNRYHLTTGGIKMYQYGQMTIVDKDAWDKKAADWAEKSVIAAQDVAKEIVGEQQKFYDFSVNSFVLDARKIIVGPMGFKLKEPVKTDKPLIGWSMALEGDYGPKDNRPWEKYYVSVSLRYPLLHKTGNELLAQMHEEIVNLSKSKWEGVSGQNAGIGDEGVFFKLERQLKYGDDDTRISLKERIRLRCKNVFVEVTGEAYYNPKDLQIVLKTKEIAGAVASRIGSGGAVAPAQSKPEPPPEIKLEQQRAQTPQEPEKPAQPTQSAQPEPQKTEQKSVYDNVKQINNDVKDAGNKLNKAYESLKSLF